MVGIRSTATATVADALFTSTQQRVLALLFGQPERAFQMHELITLARAGSGAVQREVARLVASGLVGIELTLGRKQYKAVKSSPVFRELRSIVRKISGVAEVLRDALGPEASRIDAALLYGSLAKGTATASSDVDVLIVSDELTLEATHALLAVAERRLGRRVSPTVYTRDELARRRAAKSAFVTKVLAGEHELLMGRLDEGPR